MILGGGVVMALLGIIVAAHFFPEVVNAPICFDSNPGNEVACD